MKSRFIHTTALAIMMATLAAACRGGFAAKDDVDAPLAVDGAPGTGDAAVDAAPVDAATADATANYPARPPVYFSDPIGVHPKVQVHAPADYTPTSAYPLVIFLCGSALPSNDSCSRNSRADVSIKRQPPIAPPIGAPTPPALSRRCLKRPSAAPRAPSGPGRRRDTSAKRWRGKTRGQLTQDGGRSGCLTS